ncbi:MAG: hypothetical protein ABSG74_10135 [Candidatus Bathyarchaeia archaeon]
MSDRGLKARIALLEYYASLMQSYKVFILTFAVSILTVFEIWFRIPRPEPIWDCLLSLFLAGFVGGIFVSIARWLWCGQIVTSAINAPAPSVPVPTMEDFDREIKDYAYVYSRTWKGRITRLGDCKILLGIVWLLLVLAFFVIVQAMAPLFQT